MKKRAVFLDFDGVVVDSMEKKLESYLYAMQPFAVPAEAVKRIQIRDAGLSRHVILKSMYHEIFDNDMSDSQFAEALERFTQNDEAARQSMEFLPGAQEFLESVHNSVILALVTGTPQDVINRTAEHLSLNKWFSQIRGAPLGKAQHIQELLSDFDLKPSEACYVGDGSKDQDAAEACGISFIGVATKENPFRSEYIDLTVEHLPDILPWLNEV